MKAKKLISLMSAAALASLLAVGCSDTQRPPGGEHDYNVPSGIVPDGSESSPAVQSTSQNSVQSVPESTPENTPVITPQSTPTGPEAPYVPPTEGQQGEVAGSIMVLENGRGIMLYGIGYEPGRNYAATDNKYKEQLGEYVNVYSMVIPTSVTFYMPEKYFDQGVSDRELPHIEDINDHLSGIIPIDAYAALRDHVNEDIYYRTDHHWTQLGAYYAAKAFAETALVPFDDLSAYDRHEKDGYLGTLYGSSENDPRIGNNPETFFWYVPKREVVTTYYDTNAKNGYEGNYFYKPDDFNSTVEWNLTYMAGDSRIVRVETGLDTGRKLMIIKDSYADSMAPCLFGSFDEIWVVDMRFCTTSAVQLAKDNDITDLLFCSDTFSATAQNQYKLEEIM